MASSWVDNDVSAALCDERYDAFASDDVHGADRPACGPICGCAVAASGLLVTTPVEDGKTCCCCKRIVCKVVALLVNVALTIPLLVFHYVTIYVLPCISVVAHHVIGKLCCVYCPGFCYYHDLAFPANDHSIGDALVKERDKPQTCCDHTLCCIKCYCVYNDPMGTSSVEWRRLPDLLKDQPTAEGIEAGAKLFEDAIKPEDVCQGALGDCWLLAAIAAVAEVDGGDLIRGLFLTQEAEPCGCYRVKLFDAFANKWKVFTIDDRVPMGSNGKSPMFSKPNGHELWVLLLEKAFARMWGSYAALDGNVPSVALEAFTGNVRVDMKPKQYAEKHSSEQLFKVFDKALDEKVVIVVGTHGKDEGKTNDLGLVPGHAYTVLDSFTTKDGANLLQLRNPWGRGEYSGPYSQMDKDKGTWSQGGTTHHGKEIAHEPGTFWLPWWVFEENFDYAGFCATSTSINTLHLTVHEEYGVCGAPYGCVVGAGRFFCCAGPRAMWCPRRRSTHEILTTKCGMEYSAGERSVLKGGYHVENPNKASVDHV